MQVVGVRELKARLSHYLRLVKTGDVVLVTEHGRVIAALSPPTATELPRELAGLQALVARGIAVPGRPKGKGSYPRTGLESPEGTAQRLIDEVRDDAR
jgi:prevent-host-death family protein